MRVLADAPAIGQTPDIQTLALQDYMRSFRAAQNELDYLAHARPADWETRVSNSIKMAGSELTGLERWIRGKTGNPEAEQKLAALWGDVFRKAREMQDNAPSVASQLYDRTELYLTDFWKGVKDANDSYVRWAVENSGPILKKYHETVNRHYQAKNDLKRLKAAGVSVAEQGKAVADTEVALNRIRNVFSAISSVSIDNVAQEQYGKYITLEVAIAVIIAVGLAAIGGLVTVVWYAAKKAEDLINKAKAAAAETIKAGEAAAGRATAQATQQAQTAAEQVTEQAKRALVPVLVGGGILAAVVVYFVTRKKN